MKMATSKTCLKKIDILIINIIDRFYIENIKKITLSENHDIYYYLILFLKIRNNIDD